MRAKERWVEVAAHEAGHAVAAVVAHQAVGSQRLAFGEIKINPDATGYTSVSPLFTTEVIEGTMNSRRRADRFRLLRPIAMWDATIGLAGPFAGGWAVSLTLEQELFVRRRGSDYKQVRSVLARCRRVAGAAPALEDCEEQANELVLRQGAAILALANALLSQKAIAYEQAMTIIGPRLTKT